MSRCSYCRDDCELRLVCAEDQPGLRRHYLKHRHPSTDWQASWCRTVRPVFVSRTAEDIWNLQHILPVGQEIEVSHVQLLRIVLEEGPAVVIRGRLSQINHQALHVEGWITVSMVTAERSYRYAFQFGGYADQRPGSFHACSAFDTAFIASWENLDHNDDVGLPPPEGSQRKRASKHNPGSSMRKRRREA